MKDNRLSCFIIMPFDDEFRKVYDECIQPLIEKKLGMRCVRIDEWPSSKMTVIDNIKANIQQCLFAIADLSMDKPNVYYEIGLAHAIGKDVVFIKNKELGELKLPFDISPWHVFVYDKVASDYGKIFNKIVRMIRTDYPDVSKARRTHKKEVSPIVGNWKGEYQIEKDGNRVLHEVELTIVSKGKIFEAFTKITIDRSIKLVQSLDYHFKLKGDEWGNGNWIEFVGNIWGNRGESINDYWFDVYAVNKDTDGESLQVKIWDNVNTEKKEVVFEKIS